MPWKLINRGGGFATRTVKGARIGKGRSKLHTGYVTIYKDGVPIDTAGTATIANERIKKYKSGALPLPTKGNV